MVALPRTRGFSVRSWQILLANNNLNAARLYMALTFFLE